MPDDLFGPVGPQDPYRLPEEPPWSAKGGAPKPKPPQPPQRAQEGGDGGQGTGSWFPSSKPQPMTWKQGIVLAAVGVPVLAFVVVMAVWQNRHRVLGTKSFTGADPPLITTGSGSDDVRGTLPFADIIGYLKELGKG